MMKLYGSGKSRSFRALWALEEASLDYDYINVKFGSVEEHGTASEGYKKINFEGKVPTLTNDDLVLIESGAIVNYVAALSAKTDLMPTDDVRYRAKYDEVNYFILTELEQGLWTSGKHRFALPEEHRIEQALSTATFEFNKAVTTLHHWFDGSGYILGEQFTMSDILLAHTLMWAESFEFDVPKELLAYKNRMFAREACIRALNKLT
ncbi:MAG: glutathione S-transferase [Enterobacterales bacterium]|jgi:glutathione S-transferase